MGLLSRILAQLSGLLPAGSLVGDYDLVDMQDLTDDGLEPDEELQSPRRTVVRANCEHRVRNLCSFEPRYSVRPIVNADALAVYRDILENQEMADEDAAAMLVNRTYLGDVCTSCGAVANPQFELTTPGVSATEPAADANG